MHATRHPAATALSLCTLLRELADTRRCTILCTLHQPSAKIFSLFHNLLLLQVGGQRKWVGEGGCRQLQHHACLSPVSPGANPLSTWGWI